MQGEKRSLFGLIENYVDMIVNLLAIYIAFFFTCLIDQNPPFNPTNPYLVLTLLSVVIITSFV